MKEEVKEFIKSDSEVIYSILKFKKIKLSKIEKIRKRKQKKEEVLTRE